VEIEYALNGLRPISGLQLELRNPSGKMRRVGVTAKMTRKPLVPHISDLSQAARERSVEEAMHLSRPREVYLNDLMILKLPDFNSTESTVQGLLDRARKYKALILDLRGNPGGQESTLLNFIGSMFEKDVKLADRITRTEGTPVIARSKRNGIFRGKLIVLVDSKSDVGCRTFCTCSPDRKTRSRPWRPQLRRVMEAQFYPHRTYTGVLYGAMVTTADLVMTDSKSLEHAGVMPDETILPTAADLVDGRDPVMVRAAEITGVNLSPEKAAGLFPYEWPRE